MLEIEYELQRIIPILTGMKCNNFKNKLTDLTQMCRPSKHGLL